MKLQPWQGGSSVALLLVCIYRNSALDMFSPSSAAQSNFTSNLREKRVLLAGRYNFPKEKPTFGHEREEDQINHSEEPKENDVRDVPGEEVIKCKRAVSQLVQKTHYDQIAILQEVASIDKVIGDADHED